MDKQSLNAKKTILINCILYFPFLFSHQRLKIIPFFFFFLNAENSKPIFKKMNKYFEVFRMSTVTACSTLSTQNIIGPHVGSQNSKNASA